MSKKKNNIKPIQMITVFTNLGRYIQVPKYSLKSAVQRGIIDDYIHIEHQDDNKENLKKTKNKDEDPFDIDSEIYISGSAVKCIKMLKQIKKESSPSI